MRNCKIIYDKVTKLVIWLLFQQVLEFKDKPQNAIGKPASCLFFKESTDFEVIKIKTRFYFPARQINDK